MRKYPICSTSIGFVSILLLLFNCQMPPPITPEEQLIARGRNIFFTETFSGNGRTCGTCHPAENNFTLDAQFIATLPNDDPLFVAEFNPDLRENFENPRLMRELGLIVENLDGFDDLQNKFTMRGIPHTLGLQNSVNSNLGPHTGWSGDGAPGDASLRSFATGAVIQHFTKTLNRVAGVDFRLPTEEELDALEAFQLSLGRQEELELPLPLKSVVAARGQEIFNSTTEGKCFACHFNAGANGAPDIFGEEAGNLNFNTGVEELEDHPADLTGELVPPDDGFGIPGDGTFNTPSLVEAADTPPFFHNNAVSTIEGAVEFYDSETFNNSPAGQLLINATGSGIELEVTQVSALAAFLRVINTLENIRQSIRLLEAKMGKIFLPQEDPSPESLLRRAVQEIDDAITVLTGGGLHPQAVQHLKAARKFTRKNHPEKALRELERARTEIIETS